MPHPRPQPVDKTSSDHVELQPMLLRNIDYMEHLLQDHDLSAGATVQVMDAQAHHATAITQLLCYRLMNGPLDLELKEKLNANSVADWYKKVLAEAEQHPAPTAEDNPETDNAKRV